MTFDCFTFFNELELLDIRLNTMNDVVDRFVIVEATRTHQNNPKPLHYDLNRSSFARFQDKIIHVVVDDYPAFPSGWKEANSWDLERHQRNCISRGLTTCVPGDVVIVSDLDEVPDPKKVAAFRDKAGIKVFEQRNFYYYLNCINQEGWWYGSVMAHFGDFKKPQDLRSVSKKMHGERKKILTNKIHRIAKSIIHPIYRNPISIIPQAGWHFCYIGGADKIVEKLEAFAHTERNLEQFKNKRSIEEALNAGWNIFDPGKNFRFISLDESYPDYILRNKVKFAHLIKN